VLVGLVRDAGRLVTKEALLARVWPDTFVEEGILTVRVANLRRALGDSPSAPVFIETVARSGYRFIASVTRSTLAERVPSPTHSARPLEASELVGRGRAHLMSASYFTVRHAIEPFEAAIEIDPTYAAAHAGLALARCAQAQLRVTTTRQAYAAVTRHMLEHTPRQQPAAAIRLSILHGELGEFDDAFDRLDRALDERDPAVLRLAVAPQRDAVRGDRRFIDRLARMGLSHS